jgi:branched-chain amino acid transport system substrate-binding protein
VNVAPSARIAAVLALFLTLLQGCSDHAEQTIGFLGPLEGKYSDLGVQGRNGAQLAFEEANAQQSIPGITFRLVAADDRNTPEGTELAMAELAASHPVAIIGPMTSGVAQAALEKATALGIPLVSPTVSTPQLTGKKDLFFRVLGENVQWAKALARHGREHEHLQTAVLVADMDNAAYSGPYRDAFRAEFLRLGGTVLHEWEIHSSTQNSWTDIAAQIQSFKPDLVFVSLSARDSSSLAKTFVTSKQQVTVYAAMWAATRELVVDCGKACADWTFGMGYSDDAANPTHTSFLDRYIKRFGFAPNFAAVLSYEAAQVVIQGLAKAAGNPRDLPGAMRTLPQLPGLIGPFQINEFGDVIRDSYIVTFNGTEFRTHETIR